MASLKTSRRQVKMRCRSRGSASSPASRAAPIAAGRQTRRGGPAVKGPWWPATARGEVGASTRRTGQNGAAARSTPGSRGWAPHLGVGLHISPPAPGPDAIASVKIAIAEAERLGGAPFAQSRLVSARVGNRRGSSSSPPFNSQAFKGAAFAKFHRLPDRADPHLRPPKSSGQNGVPDGTPDP